MATTLLTRFFPVPRFLATPMAGFDLSSDSLKIVELKENHKGRKVEKYASVSLPPGCISRGEIKNQDILTKHLIEVRKKYGLKYIAVSLPEERAYVFSFYTPYVPPKELRGSLELQLEERIPIPVDKAIFDYEVLEVDPNTGKLFVNVSVMPSDVVTSFYSVLLDAGFVPLLFDTEAHSLARAVISEHAKETNMLVDLGNTRSVFAITSGQTPMFNATIDFGGADITEAIRKERNISLEEAEKLKLTEGISRGVSDDIFSSAISSLAVLKDEVNKYYSYWNGRVGRDEEKKSKIDKIIFTGGGSGLKGLNDFLSGYLEVPFSLADVWTNVADAEENIPPIHKNESLQYATAIGLALTNFKRP